MILVQILVCLTAILGCLYSIFVIRTTGITDENFKYYVASHTISFIAVIVAALL